MEGLLVCTPSIPACLCRRCRCRIIRDCLRSRSLLAHSQRVHSVGSSPGAPATPNAEHRARPSHPQPTPSRRFGPPHAALAHIVITRDSIQRIPYMAWQSPSAMGAAGGDGAAPQGTEYTLQGASQLAAAHRSEGIHSGEHTDIFGRCYALPPARVAQP